VCGEPLRMGWIDLNDTVRFGPFLVKSRCKFAATGPGGSGRECYRPLYEWRPLNQRDPE
jgi:hypothetical protein